GYETSASTPKESGAVQSFAGPVEDTNRLTIKQRTDKAPSLISAAGSDSVPEELLESTPDQPRADYQAQGKTDRLQVKAENPGNLKTTGYETSASTPKESGAVQSFAGPVEDTNRLTIKQRTDKAPSLISAAGSDSVPEELLESTPDQPRADYQAQGKIDRLQSIVEDFISLEVAPFGLSRKGTAKFKTEQYPEGIIAQGSGHEGNKSNNTGYIESVRTDTWMPSFLKNPEISTNYTPDKDRVLQLLEVSDGDEKVTGLQRQSDLLQNLVGSLSKSTGIPGSAASKQESVVTYQQVPIAELPSVVLSALRSSGSREKLIRINLIPENLGPLTIKVKEIKDKLVIHFIASSSDSKEILEISMPQLKQSISQLSGSTNETLVFLSQGQGQGKDNHAQGGWNYFNNSLIRLSDDSVGGTQQTFENGLNGQGEARSVNYWV
ncbi:MAG: flagellar hook-length control protein FliK, partial [Eubacteriales bacterium]